MKRTAVTLMLLLAGAAGAANYATATKHDESRAPSREASPRKVQWAPSGNFSALHGRAVFEGGNEAAARPYAREGREVAAVSFYQRWYDSQSGRFLSRDSVGASSYLATPSGLGPWAYANLNPARFLDPDGRDVGQAEALEREYEVIGAAERANALGLPTGRVGNPFAPWPLSTERVLPVSVPGDSPWLTSLVFGGSEQPALLGLLKRAWRSDRGRAAVLPAEFTVGPQLLRRRELIAAYWPEVRQPDLEEGMDWFGNGSILIGTYPFDTTVLIRRELSELGMNSTDLEFMAAYSEGVVGMRKAWWLSGAVLTVSSLYEAGLLQMEAAAARAEAAAALEMASHELPGLVDATVTPAADQALLPIFRVRDGKFQALIRSNGGTGPVRWTNIEGPPSTAVHGNSLLAMGPHDVYAVRSAMDQTAKGGGQVSAGQVLHFGETGRGWETRGNEWARYLRQKYGLESFAEPLRTVEGKAAGKTTETKYIDYYEKVFGKKPGFEDASGNWVKIQKTRH